MQALFFAFVKISKNFRFAPIFGAGVSLFLLLSRLLGCFPFVGGPSSGAGFGVLAAARFFPGLGSEFPGLIVIDPPEGPDVTEEDLSGLRSPVDENFCPKVGCLFPYSWVFRVAYQRVLGSVPSLYQSVHSARCALSCLLWILPR